MRKIILLLSVVFFLPVMVFAAEKGVETSSFSASWGALLPPVAAITLALITKEVYSSLFAGVLLGGCLAADFAPLKILDIVVKDGIIEAVKATSGIFVFLVILGTLVALIQQTGAAAAFGNWAQKHVKTRVGAILATILLGILIFVDDYFNCLTVGSVMTPVSDAKRVSRAKLAYVIDATAAPICMIAPVSSWAAAVSQYANDPGQSGLELFIAAIPYNFYSLLTLFFVFCITLLKLDYGPMARHEYNALKNGDLFTSKPQEVNSCESVVSSKGRVCDIVIPTLLLITLCTFSLLHNGGWLREGKSFVAAFSATDASVALPWGALLVLILSIFYLSSRKVITFRKAVECLPRGFNAMVPAILILTLATALKNTTSLLKLSDYISTVMGNAAPGLAQFLPVVIFIVACFLSFSTGTAWGTFGILIPIVAAIFPPSSQLLYIGISACLAGAVCGDHCSPISDTTIMSAAGAQCDLINHVSTQLPYAVTVAFFSAVGFLLAGFIQNWFVVFPVTAVLLLAMLVIAKFWFRKKYSF